jgi:dTDP-4-amino-4,6-dideoxygalactose transaminase
MLARIVKIPIARPATGDEEWQALRAPLEDGWLTQGPRVEAFEREFAARHGVAHAVACTSATTGLHLALAALGVGAGDEVVVPSFTWVATANAVVSSGATPILCDVDRTTFNIDPASLAAKVSKKTRAVIPVHLFGLCADMDRVAAAAPGIPLVEDAACAAGATLGDRSAGSMGVCGVFSFHPRKTITTGEGGMVTTNDAVLAARLRTLRNHAGPDFDLLGFNYRMTDLQAAVGSVQLTKLDRFIAERAAIAAVYRRELARLSWLHLPDEPHTGRHGWQSFVCMVDHSLDRATIMRSLDARGIATRVGTHAIHMLPFYRDRLALKPDDLPAARDCDRHSLALPLHNRLGDADVAEVVDALRALG